MLKMVIAFDEEKVLAVDDYDIEQMYGAMDALFAEHGVLKIAKGVYTEKEGDKKALGRMAHVSFVLEEQEWFVPYLKTFMFYLDTDTEDWKKEITGEPSILLEQGAYR